MKPAICLVLLAIVPPASMVGEAPLEPVTVCEVLKDSKLYDGRVVALLGRYSYRTEGRWIGEDTCKIPENSTNTPSPEIIWLSYAPDSAPRMVSGYTVDGAAVAQKILLVKKNTTLRKFRFGSPDYDRWAVVYGRLRVEEKVASESGKKDARPQPRNGAAAELLYAGDGYVMFLRDPATQ
jgi:hypothetical protein